MRNAFDWIEEKGAVEKIAASEIDTGWYSSWYWDMDQYGHISLAGWQKALKDAEGNCESARKNYERRREFLEGRLRPLVKHLEQRKAEMIADEALAEAADANLPDAAVVDAIQKGG